MTASNIDGSAFSPASQAEWLKAVEKVLRGKPFETLVTTEAGGVTRQPLYTEESVSTQDNESGLPGFAPYMRGAKTVNDRFLPWQISSRIVPGRKNSEASDVSNDLSGGASVLLIDMSQTKLPNANQLAKLLDGVMLDIAPLMVRAGKHEEAAFNLILNHLTANNAAQAKAYLDFDPLGHAAMNNETVNYDALTKLVEAGNQNQNLRLMTASGVPYHNAGADNIVELACILATSVAYARALEEKGLSLEAALSRITLTSAADCDFFSGIAKLRALRALWSQITKACDCPDVLPQIHAEGSERNFSVADPWVNILRATIATLGAGIGGANIITVAPCTAVSKGDNELTRRVARNTQVILQEENHIGRVIDPAGGSWYIEQLTSDLVQSAWTLFQEIEAAGGMQQAISAGMIGARIAAIREQRNAAIRHRNEPILGVSEFPNLDEALLEARPAIGKGALAEQRFAAPYEALRQAAEPVKPKIYLATLGTQSAFTPRAHFAANLFAVGGIDALIGNVGEDGTDAASITNIAKDFAASGAKIAAICGTDDDYRAYGSALAKALKEAGVTYLWVVGKFEADDIDEAFSSGCDALAILKQAHHVLGLSK